MSFSPSLMIRLTLMSVMTRSTVMFGDGDGVVAGAQMKALGVKDINNFAADDLFEGKRMKQ
eukprot:1494094-Rhodomonas_salina.1